MVDFEFHRINDNELDIRTSSRVTRNVWDFFMKEVFKKIGVDTTQSPRTGINAQELYLNRGRVPDESEIADGQIGDYWVHAYLQAGDRTVLKRGNLGKIYVPAQQIFYLDYLTGDLRKYSNERNGLLEQFAQIEKQTLEELMKSCLRTLYSSQESQHLREIDIRKSIMTTLPYNNWTAHVQEYELKINNLPESTPGDFNKLEYQICLDFLRTFDTCLHMEEENDSCDVLKTTLEMAKAFSSLLDTKLS